MKTIFYILMFLFLMTSCEEKNEEVHIVVEKEQPKQVHFPVLIDTFQFDATYRNLKERDFGNYRPLYFGDKKDTLIIDYDIPKLYNLSFELDSIFVDSSTYQIIPETKVTPKIIQEKYAKYFLDLNFRYDSIPPTWEEAKIEITIDTAQIIRNIGRTKYENDEFVYNAYSVILENTSDTAILIGYGSHIPLILEAKDKNGDWKAVEFQYTYPCGNGLPSITLPKNEIVLTSVPILKVEKGTKWRLKIGNNYSEEFWGGE